MDSLEVVFLYGPVEEHGYLGLPRDSREDYGASFSSSNLQILELHLFSMW